MKSVISIIVGILVFIGIFCIDGAIIKYILDLFPRSAADWLPLLKVILWICAIIWTTGLAIILSMLAGALVRIFLGE